MSDTDYEHSQDDTEVEITPLPEEDKGQEAQGSSNTTAYRNSVQDDRRNRSGVRRYLLMGLTLCMVMALFLITVVLPRIQSPKLIAQPSTAGISPTLNASTIPANTSTDYSVHTTIVNGVAYAGAANGGVYALNASDGRLLWRHKIDPGAGSAPLVSNGMVYITANRSDVGPGTLYALRASDGQELWRYSSINSLSDPLSGNNKVFVTSFDEVSQNGKLVALRAGNGTQLWCYKTVSGFSYSTPVVDNQNVYVSASTDNGSSMLFALRASDGTQLWRKTSNTFTSISLAVNGIAYLLSNQGLSALSANNGQLLWRTPIEGDSTLLPQVINGVLYLTTTNTSLEGSGTPTSQGSILPQVGMIGNLLQGFATKVSNTQAPLLKQGISSVYAVSISDGAVLWHYGLSKENGNNWANWLSVEDGTVYVGSYVDQNTSYIYALRSDNGSLLWRQTMYKGMSVNAFVTGGAIYIASFINSGSINDGSGAVYALRANDGSEHWSHSMYWVVYDPPVLVGATLYVSTASGDVYAFQAGNGSLLWHFHTDV